jgi:hypothetical protein
LTATTTDADPEGRSPAGGEDRVSMVAAGVEEVMIRSLHGMDAPPTIMKITCKENEVE